MNHTDDLGILKRKHNKLRLQFQGMTSQNRERNKKISVLEQEMQRGHARITGHDSLLSVMLFMQFVILLMLILFFGTIVIGNIG